MRSTDFSSANSDLKNDLVDKILLVGSTIGLGVFLISLFPLDLETINADFYWDIGALSILFSTYFFRHTISMKIKLNIIISILMLIYISDLLENGLYTPDMILLVLIPFFAILCYSLSVTFIIYGFSAIVFIGIGYLFHTGMITSPDYDISTHSIYRWYEHLLLLSVVTFVITLFLNKFNNRVYSLIKNLEKRNDDLIEREGLLSTITDSFPRSFVLVINGEQSIISTGGSEFKNGRYNPSRVLGRTIKELLRQYPASVVKMVSRAHAKTIAGNEQEFELEFNNQILQVKTTPLRNSRNEVHSILAVLENITERVETQQLIQENLHEKNVLLQEIHHRVKNNLAVVSGLLELQSYHIDDPKSKMILGKSTNRILSIAKVHEMLYESKKFNNIPFHTYINELSEIILASMNGEGKSIEFKTNILVEELSINHGVPLGIIFNELITNSVKYGFDDPDGNEIHITVEPEGKYIRVVYMDNGVGIKDFDKALGKSLGFTLIQSLMEQIDAEYEYQTRDHFKLSFRFRAEVNHSVLPMAEQYTL